MQRVPWTELELFTIVWPEAKVEGSPPSPDAPKSKHLRSIDWIIMRASWGDPSVPLLAAKGGTNDDPHHGHLDVGQFAINYEGEWFVRELGYMQPSDFGYWHYQRRYKEHIHANAEGHNVISVNGEWQEFGEEYRGEVVEFESSPARDYTLIDASKAYPGTELRGWRRHIIYEKPHFFVILDDVKSSPGANILFRIHPGVPFDVGQRLTLLQGQGGTMASITLAPSDFQVREKRHPIQAKLRSGQFYFVAFYDVLASADSEHTYLVNIFLPVENQQEAEEVVQSSKATQQGSFLDCVISYRGHEYAYRFDLSQGAAVFNRAVDNGHRSNE